MNETTTTASMTTVLAELVLIATRKNLPTPRYMTVADGEPFKQIGLTLGNRTDLDAWNAAFGDVHVSELPPRPDAPDVLVTTMHGGALLGWTVNLQARVPAPLSPEVLAALGEAARSDAQVLVAEAVAEMDQPKPMAVTDYQGDEWRLDNDGRWQVYDGDEPQFIFRTTLAEVDADYGPLVEVQPRPAPAVWDDSVPPGGFVCSVCRTPVESEPCALHGEAVQS